MKLLKFRIKNYKSIVDTGACYFSDKITILAGKNECGKTTILEALEDFHEDRVIRDDAVPIGLESVPEVWVTFSLSKEDLSELYQEAGVDIVPTEDIELELYKRHGLKGYHLAPNTRKTLGWTSTFVSVRKEIAQLTLTATPPKFTTQTFSKYSSELKAFQTGLPADGPDTEKLAKLIKVIDDHVGREAMVQRFVSAFIATKLPYFILFSSFDESFPDTIPVAELGTNSWAADLQEVSSFHKETIASTNRQRQNNHQRTVNAEFTEKFKKFWTQDDICLEVMKEGDTVGFWIVEDNTSYMPSQRSKGQQWYLSFYIRIVARISEKKPNVILIDEPGLFLHARAQKDLLGVLENHTSYYPVIFSTHSPYLITEDNLENVRLIEKKQRQTTILGKIHAHETADKETLTPILTAIGLGVNDSITNLEQKNNVVVEGPEDVFYLQAYKLLLPAADRPKINFVHGGGAGKMGVVGSILEGWGASVLYLFDHDQGGSDGGQELRKRWKALPEIIKSIPGEAVTSADILSGSDFKQHVLGNESLKYTTKNSVYIKNNKLEKVLLARQFLQASKKGKVRLSEESTQNIKALLKELAF